MKDNLFKFEIKSLPSQNVKTYLTYDLFGVQDCNAVSKSINNRPAMGGYVVKNQMGWSVQKEENIITVIFYFLPFYVTP